MRLFNLCALSSALLLAACGGGSGGGSNDGADNGGSGNGGSGNGGGSSQVDQFSYVLGLDGSIASVSTQSHKGEVVVESTPFAFFPQKLNSSGETELAALFALHQGQLVQLTPENNVPKVVSSLSNLNEDSFCDMEDQENGSNPRLFFSMAGDDQDCATSNDNPVFYVDASMTTDNSPVRVNNTALFTAIRAEAILSSAYQTAGYLVREQTSEGNALRYYNNLFSQFVTVDAGAGYNPETETFSVTDFFNTNRTIIRLGDDYYDASVTNLSDGQPGLKFLTASDPKEVKTTSDRAYLALGSDYYRHNIGRSDVKEFSTLNLAGSVGIAILENASIIASDDNVNNRIQRFLQADERGDSVTFQLLTQADYDRTGTSSSSFGMSSTGRGALVEISLRYDSTDDEEYALYIASNNTITRFDDAEWLNTSLNSSSPFFNRPLYSQLKNDGLTVAEVNENNLATPLIYGSLPAGVESVRAESFPVDGQLIITTRSSQADLNGLVYQIKPGEAGSLRQIDGLKGFSVGI